MDDIKFKLEIGDIVESIYFGPGTVVATAKCNIGSIGSNGSGLENRVLVEYSQPNVALHNGKDSGAIDMIPPLESFNPTDSSKYWWYKENGIALSGSEGTDNITLMSRPGAIDLEEYYQEMVDGF